MQPPSCLNDPAHDATHLQRVWATAQILMREHPEADAQVVHAACMWHDCVNLPKNHPQRAQASRLAAQKAMHDLRGQGFPEHKLAAVAHAIEAHSFSAGIPPETIEARIVQDADRLDALGPVGIARMFSVGAQLGRALAHPSDPLALMRSLDDSSYTLDHIAVKLATLPESMQTAAGHRLGAERLAWVLSFRHAFVQQWTGMQKSP
ncbi:HD domain-containing protein [Comamonas sp. NoAH]|uniref:HD domain-containing protein n=1 Tax=Comamonas halotolerans TaxID=3041496 RepID=UPI0024E0852F|nr:HD domain-containing protein [Comamonas sp. NoAH]